MLILGESDVAKALNMKECLDINRQALITISENTSYVPSRLGLPYPNHPNQPKTTVGAQDWTLIKPSAYYGENNDLAMGMKVISVRAQNPSNGLPLTPATILLLDPESGIVESVVAGTHITVARTSAGPALAVQAFRPDVQHLVVFGAGAQATLHIEYMQLALERRIPKITIINRTRERAEKLKSKILAEQTSDQEVDIVLLSDTEAKNNALSTADVVAATTNTTEPLFEDGRILRRNCLITGIGSYTPDMKEIPSSAVDRCHVVIDTPEAMEVGDLKHLGALETTSHPVTLAGVAWKDPGLIGKHTDCIFYKAVGTAIQDLLTTRAVVHRAKKLGLGQEVDMT
jgi:ornithine cyclodeaminase